MLLKDTWKARVFFLRQSWALLDASAWDMQVLGFLDVSSLAVAKAVNRLLNIGHLGLLLTHADERKIFAGEGANLLIQPSANALQPYTGVAR